MVSVCLAAPYRVSTGNVRKGGHKSALLTSTYTARTSSVGLHSGVVCNRVDSCAMPGLVDHVLPCRVSGPSAHLLPVNMVVCSSTGGRVGAPQLSFIACCACSLSERPSTSHSLAWDSRHALGYCSVKPLKYAAPFSKAIMQMLVRARPATQREYTHGTQMPLPPTGRCLA